MARDHTQADVFPTLMRRAAEANPEAVRILAATYYPGLTASAVVRVAEEGQRIALERTLAAQRRP